MDDSLIVYTGTVTPIAQVPDYRRWSTYGGNASEHTFNQVPNQFLTPLPRYDAGSADAENTYSVYSMGHLSSYATGEENSGSHVGVDIRVPTGTPIRAVMNGVVERVDTAGNGGLGVMVMLRHPNVPDPVDPKRMTTLYSIYGHLNSALVREGDDCLERRADWVFGANRICHGPASPLPDGSQRSDVASILAFHRTRAARRRP